MYSGLVVKIIVIAGLSLFCIACRSSSPELPDTSGSAVWAFLQEVNYQEKWELWPGKGEKYQGGNPTARSSLLISTPPPSMP